MGMGISITIVSFALCTGLVVWLMQRAVWRSRSVPPVEMSHQAQAHKAFVHGNTCLFNGDIARAITSFQLALELDPSHPHAANRLSEAERRQAERATELVRIAS